LQDLEREMAYNVTKSEHGGAKNGGGHWGPRAYAKKASNKLRRATAKKEARSE